jgi:tetratricopeptide (TPR) repeat protein
VADNDAARQYAQEALQIAQDLGARTIQAGALTSLGHALVALGHPAEAVVAYQQALNLRREAELAHLAVESLAGLAEASLLLGEVSQAEVHAEEVLSYLQGNPLEGLDEPIRVYLACYRVLHAVGDGRAPEVLATAYNILQTQAAKITDERHRVSFLERVPAHAEVVRLYARSL